MSNVRATVKRGPVPVHLRAWIFFQNLPENWGLTQRQKSERYRALTKLEKESYNNSRLYSMATTDSLSEYSESEWATIREIRKKELK